MNTRRIVIFASGNGTNAENLIRFFKEDIDVQVVSVFSNKAGAGVLGRAQNLRVPAHVFTREEMMDGRLLSHIKSLKPDCIVLAGFLWLLPADFINAYRGRLINIHPALLPSYGGKGMYGDRVHQAVISNGEKESGITIHLVDEQYDQGAILFQARCPVLPDDTPQTLAQRVHRLEYEHFPVIVKRYVIGEL